MALAERTWERVGERKRDRAGFIESAELLMTLKYVSPSPSQLWLKD